LKINKKRNRKKTKKRIILLITLVTFMLSVVFTLISNIVSDNVGIVIAAIAVMVIVFIGIFFDMIGVAVATANEVPFHSLASKRVKGSKKAISIIRHANVYATFFNDVVGDVCGIVSGAATTAIVIKLLTLYDYNALALSIFFGSFVAAVTVGGKSIGKEIAMNNSDVIVFKIAKIISNK